MAKVLVIEDESDIIELIKYNLEKEGHLVRGALNGEEGLKAAQRDLPDVVILDIMLPGMNGLDVCKRLKSNQETMDIPIVMVSAKGEEHDIVLGLELGADDYMTKPFSPRILTARVNAVLRRHTAGPLDNNLPIKIHGMEIDPGHFEVKYGSNVVVLTNTEFRILHHLARHAGWVFTRYQIVEAVKGDDYPVTERAVDVQIVGLRKKLGDTAKYIETVRGVGYRFKE